MENGHSCQACNTKFPEGTSKRRKYCNDACRMRLARTQQRATITSPNSADQLALQNDQLRQQVSRLQAELAKVHDRAMGYRRETHTLRRETGAILDVRRQSLLHFHTQHQQLRATYRQAHLLITRFGLLLADLYGATPPVTTAWRDTENVPGDMLRGPLPSDKDNAATLTHFVADTITQLESLIGVSRHQSRTRRDTPPGDGTPPPTPSATTPGWMTAGPATPTPAADASTLLPEVEQLRSDLDTAHAVIAKQRQQMLLAKNAHTTLREQYAHQRQLIEQLTTDREHTKIIIRQWLILARELYRRTAGRPAAKHHQTIIATWQQYETWAKEGTGS